MAESVPVTAEVLARALATLPRPPWYEAEPFKTILAVVIGGFLTLAANWWLKHLELQARADSLKVAFRGEVGALRSSLRVEAKHARTTYEADGLLTGGVTYSRTVFEQNASHIGDLGDPTLVPQLASLYALLARLEVSGRLFAAGAPGREQLERHLGGLASAFYVSVLVDMRLGAQTAKLRSAPFRIRVSTEDADDQRLAAEIIERYGSREDRSTLEHER